MDHYIENPVFAASLAPSKKLMAILSLILISLPSNAAGIDETINSAMQPITAAVAVFICADKTQTRRGTTLHDEDVQNVHHAQVRTQSLTISSVICGIASIPPLNQFQSLTFQTFQDPPRWHVRPALPSPS